MIPMNENAAITNSIEIAKILCAARGDEYPIDVDSANEIADFIETLQSVSRNARTNPIDSLCQQAHRLG